MITEPNRSFPPSTGAILFSSDTCPVCHAVYNKIQPLFAENYPLLPLQLLRSEDHMEWCAQNQVMSMPSLVIFHEGHEIYRKAGTFGIQELASELDRLYGFLFH